MSERVDVTAKVTIESTQRSGWLVGLPDGRRIFVAVGQGYYDDADRTFHLDRPIAQKWGLAP